MTAFLAGMSQPKRNGDLSSEAMLATMSTAQARRFGIPIRGLGATLCVANNGNTGIGHDGRNQPAINTTARRHPGSGDGIVVLATGTTDLASRRSDGVLEAFNLEIAVGI